jgi:hypothetical protein
MADKTTTTRKCGDNRPENRNGEKEMGKKRLTLKDAGEIQVALTAFPGCIEGDRVTYATRGEDRMVMLYGTAEQIAHYTVGEKVSIKVEGKTTEFQRNVGRKQELGVNSIKDEMYGTGAIKKLVEEKKGTFGGYTLTANQQKVTKTSLINSMFVLKDLEKDGKPVLINDEKVKYFGGVELVICAIIIPGSPSDSYKSLDKMLN